MQKYFQEKNAMQGNISNNKKNRGSQNTEDEEERKGDPIVMKIRSDDIYGKKIEEFKQRPDLGGDHVPLIFWLLTGFFRYKMKELNRFFTTGLFRVTSSDQRVRDLEIHLSQGNYGYLEHIEDEKKNKLMDPNIVANYLKRVFRQMKEPLIPEAQFRQIGKLDNDDN